MPFDRFAIFSGLGGISDGSRPQGSRPYESFGLK